MKNKIAFIIIFVCLSILFLTIWVMAANINLTQTTFIKSINTVSTTGFCDMLSRSIIPIKCSKSVSPMINVSRNLDVSLINDKTYGNITRVMVKR